MLRENCKIKFGTPKEFTEKVQIAERCLEIANAADFPTDYDDVYEHLFGNDDYIICFLIDTHTKRIMGFSVFANLQEINMLYLHGIIIHPDVQGNSLSKRMIREVLKKVNPKYLSARTHNPRMFETLSSFAKDEKHYFPNASGLDIAPYIYNVVKSNEFTRAADECLVCRNAYPDEKISQSYRNNKVTTIFNKLNPTDAQVIVVQL